MIRAGLSNLYGSCWLQGRGNKSSSGRKTCRIKYQGQSKALILVIIWNLTRSNIKKLKFWSSSDILPDQLSRTVTSLTLGHHQNLAERSTCMCSLISRLNSSHIKLEISERSSLHTILTIFYSKQYSTPDNVLLHAIFYCTIYSTPNNILLLTMFYCTQYSTAHNILLLPFFI